MIKRVEVRDLWVLRFIAPDVIVKFERVNIIVKFEIMFMLMLFTEFILVIFSFLLSLLMLLKLQTVRFLHTQVLSSHHYSRIQSKVSEFFKLKTMT